MNTKNDVSPGFNFFIVLRHFLENGVDHRDVQKLYGIKFIVKSNVVVILNSNIWQVDSI